MIKNKWNFYLLSFNNSIEKNPSSVPNKILSWSTNIGICSYDQLSLEYKICNNYTLYIVLVTVINTDSMVQLKILVMLLRLFDKVIFIRYKKI